MKFYNSYDIMDQIKKEHILNAIAEIDKEGIRPGYTSSFYDLIYNGKKYPPKFVVILANKYATGEELDRKKIRSGPGKPTYNLLEKYGFEIIKKSNNNNMNLTETYLKEFGQVADGWFAQQTWLKERYDYFQNFFTQEYIEKAEWEDFQEMGNNIHAFVNMQIAKANALGKMNLNDIEDYRRIFKYIISKNDPINATINNLESSDSSYKLPYFGDSAISELIAYAYPDSYVTYNTRDIDALEILGIKLETIKKEKFGEKFLRYNELLTPLLEQYKKIVGQRTNTSIPLEVDQFFSWLYSSKKSDKPLNKLIDDYKQHIKIYHLKDEIYKWKFIKDYKGKPNLNAQNFQGEIKSIKLGNLVYAMSGAVLNHLAKEKPEELRNEFKALFKEDQPLEKRIKTWEKRITKLYKSIDVAHAHHQDERALSVYLTLHDPEKYTFYKNSYYLKFCDLLGEKPKGRGKKYEHYLELIKMFNNDYISKDQELLDLVQSFVPKDYNASNHLLLAQDILYQILQLSRNVGYWIFQGNPKIYDFQGAVNDGALSSWSIKAHKNKIVEGDKIIFWLTGENPGCYALGEVTSDIYKAKDEDDDFEHYLDKKENVVTERVDIKITHNLIDEPVLKNDISEIQALKKLKAGNQGTNFLASKEEYDAILDLIPESVNSFDSVLSEFDSNNLKTYFSFLNEIIQKFNLKKGDERLVFSIAYNRLNFEIGQRYCWNLFLSESRGKFGVISKDKLSPESESFTGGSKDLYYNFYNEINFSAEEELLISNAIEVQLNRTNRSPYLRHNNTDFENYAFDYLPSSPLNIKTMTEPINRILFGPPGTGKTYTLKDKYFQNYTSKETSISPEMHFKNIVKKLTWWQVITLALLELGKTKVDNIYNNRWVQQKTKLSESKTIRPTLWGQLQSHTIPDCEFVNVKSRQIPYLFNKTEDSYWEIIEEKVKEQSPELLDIKNQVDNFVPNPDKEIKRYVFTTFHQSFSYEDFIEGIKPKMENDNEEIENLTYEIQSGVFKQLCADAQNDPENRYAIFIDEINRGNISNIFGELITLIEPDKRLGSINQMSAILPYSKKEFSVPRNLDIIGTMNTADRSVEALDTALRRRFSFQEIMPDPDLLNNSFIGEFSLKDILKRINERIEVLIDRDHTIGHSYFLQVDSLEKLKLVFKDNIIPLLQEYFYGDYGKIGLVLGNGFVTYKPEKSELFSNFDNYERKDELNNGFYILETIDEKFDLTSALNELLNIKTEEREES